MGIHVVKTVLKGSAAWKDMSFTFARNRAEGAGCDPRMCTEPLTLVSGRQEASARTSQSRHCARHSQEGPYRRAAAWDEGNPPIPAPQTLPCPRTYGKSPE